MTTINLIHPRNDSEYSDLYTGYSSFPPPIGLEIIGSYIQNKIPEADIEIYDGILFNETEIYDLLNGEFVGISDWFTNHKNAMYIAKEVKKKNPKCRVVIGGPNASNLNKKILNNHSYVDYIVAGDGEESFLKLIEYSSGNIPITDVSNLYYRDLENNIKFTFQKNTNLDNLPLFDLEHLVKSDISKYNSKSKEYSESIDLTPLPISSIRGCIKAIKSGKCSYCNFPNKGIRVTNPEKVWMQIKKLYEKYGVSYLFETGDNFIVGNYPKKLLETKPKNLNVSFRIYSYPDSINSNVAKTLQKLGIKEIFMGIENINPEILHQANKYYDTTKVEESIKNCENEGIGVFLPFLFGLPGETKKTAKENHEFAHKIISKYSNIRRILYSLAVPIIGCSWFDKLITEKDLIKQYPKVLSTDNIDYTLLTKFSIEKLCKIDLDTLLEIVNSPPRLDRNKIASYGDIAGKLKK